ncbi:hypothetical protein ES702_06410 [subsurface metagenome]
MYYLDNPWSARTMAGRRPTPTTFVHLRGYPPLVKIYNRIRNITELTEIQEILNQEANLYLSNEISQVVSQTIALYGKDFVSLHCTEDGALHIYPVGGIEDGKMDVAIADGDSAALGAIADDIVDAGAIGTLSAKLRRLTQGLEDLKSLVVLAAGTNLIGNVKLAGITPTLAKAEIDFGTLATHTIITATAGLKIKITSIVFTIGGETDITFISGSTDISGPMDFGGTGEPRGMVVPHGLFPLECGTGEDFKIQNAAAEQVSGYVIYFKE